MTVDKCNWGGEQFEVKQSTLLGTTGLTFYGPIFTARCTLVQSAVLRSHVVCLSVCNVGEL